MDYEKNKTLAILKQMVADGKITQEDVEKYFPELAENDDEKIMKAIRTLILSASREQTTIVGVTQSDMFAWLEKQDEQKPQGKSALEAVNEEKVDNQNCIKPTDKVEPKFKIGDWVVYCNEDVDLITGIEENGYCINNGGYIPFVCASDIRLWTIQDAKDGDVLAVTMFPEGVWIGIFKENNGCTLNSYCFVNTEGTFKLGTYNHGIGIAVHPATKEQRDTLMKAMAEAGYTFDFEKKELKKIEQKEDMYNNLTDFEVSLKHVMEEAIECGDIHNLKADAELLISIAHKQFIKKSAEWLKNNVATYFGGGSPYEEDLISDYVRYIKQNTED